MKRRDYDKQLDLYAEYAKVLKERDVAKKICWLSEP